MCSTQVFKWMRQFFNSKGKTSDRDTSEFLHTSAVSAPLASEEFNRITSQPSVSVVAGKLS